MYGAIYGDLVGSIYEYQEYLHHNKEEMIKASNKVDLVTEESFISDDTILTIAVLEAVRNDLCYEETIRRYILDNSEKLHRENYFDYLFSPNTLKWARGEKPGNSVGNGALMRISPIPNVKESFILMNNDVIEATSVSHNSKQALAAAMCVANVIYLAKEGYSKPRIKEIVDKYFGYKYDFDLDTLRDNMKFNYTCEETLPLCLYALFTTDNFDDAIRLTLSLGGDTDTNCCIVGSMAESLYGIDEDKKRIVEFKLPQEYRRILRNK